MDYLCCFDKSIYYDAKTKYSVISVRTEDNTLPNFIAVGYGLPRNNIVQFTLSGTWHTDKKYGQQLKVEVCREILPSTLEGIKKYLTFAGINGMSNKNADLIVEYFGLDTLAILEAEPQRLREIQSIPQISLSKIEEYFQGKQLIKQLQISLQPYGVNPEIIIRIFALWGLKSKEVLENNIFELLNFAGFAFKKIDKAYLAQGGKHNHPGRLNAGLVDLLLKQCQEKGHLFIPAIDLIKTAARVLNQGANAEQKATHEQIRQALQSLIERGKVVGQQGNIYPQKLFKLEDETARRIATMLAAKPAPRDISAALAKVKQYFALNLSAKQEEAVNMAFNTNLSIITGSPGTGKTTVLKAIIEVYQLLYPKQEILLTAPTGRASRRISESTGHKQSKTLHSTLGLLVGDEDYGRFNDDEELSADLIIIDETSMADMWLTAQLFKRLKPGVKLILVGDVDQLPSVGAGDVFRELILSKAIAVTVLDQVFRQAKDSLIAHNAKFINENKTNLYYGEDFVFIESDNEQETAEIVKQFYLEEVYLHGLDNVQILSPLRSHGQASADKLNEAVREEINPSDSQIAEIQVGARSFRIGDKVMQTKNQDNVANGDIGYIRDLKPNKQGEMVVEVEFSEQRMVEYEQSKINALKFAYAMTVHKAMGSEYEVVIIPILARQMILLNRNLIYTAITRAKRRVFLVGEKDILFMAIHRGRGNIRNTLLGARICHYLQGFAKEEKAII